jgi:hypothetical protein
MRRRTPGVAAAVLAAVLAGGPARAAFHFAVIDEFMSGCGADPTMQYVEIRMLASGQTVVGDTRLAAFSCDGSVVNRLLLVPDDLGGSGGAGVRWIIGSPSFQAAAGIAPDFVMSDADPGIFPSCGQICWGAPGMFPPDPSLWDPTNPANYVDCVAYGPYTGPLHPSAGDPLGILPSTGSQSLTRAGNTAFDNDFVLAAPTPTNLAGQMGDLSECTPLTTTTTTSGGGGGSTTSTTTSGGGSTTSTTVGPALSGGGAKTDCFGEWRVAGATGTKPTVRCTDNDASCDTSPAAGCVVRAQLCFNDAQQAIYRGRCTPAPVTAFGLIGNPDAANAAAVGTALAALPGAQVAAGGVTFASPPSGLVCTGAIDLTVPLRVRGTKTKKGAVLLKSVTTAGKRDKDKLKLLCIP